MFEHYLFCKECRTFSRCDDFSAPHCPECGSEEVVFEGNVCRDCGFVDEEGRYSECPVCGASLWDVQETGYDEHHADVDWPDAFWPYSYDEEDAVCDLWPHS